MLLLLLLLQVSIVKDYVSRQLQMEGKEIAKDRDTISRLQVRSNGCCCGCCVVLVLLPMQCPCSVAACTAMQERELHGLVWFEACLVSAG
jgi:hypothetical protein